MKESEFEFETQKLREEILRVFASASYPGDENIVKNPKGDEECDVYAAFKGVDWHDVNWEWLKTHAKSPPQDCLGFMSSAGFQYYLPAYMLISIDSWEDCDVLSDNLIDYFTQQDYEKYTPEVFLNRVDSLSDEIKQTIAKFLLYIYEVYDVDRALNAYNGYWKKHYTPPERDRPSSQPA